MKSGPARRATKMNSQTHYLERELYDLIQKERSVLEFLQQGSLDGIWYWDLEKPESQWVSPRFWEILGYDPAEKKHLASEWQDVIYPDDLKIALSDQHRHCTDPDHAYDQVVRCKHKDGTTVWVRCRGTAIRDESGKAIRMIGAHNNLTPQKRAENRLSASEEKYRTFFRNAPLPYQSLDEDGCIEDINPAWSRTLGYGRKEVVGRYFREFLHPD